ncbi:hypothetical protein [Taklimakanibacter deserti]|uniref:hypothetical protein n=1 Tax=Taklimakanibacter deserti TaxID=2267839 RepID=UPI0013C47B7A
MRTLPLPPVTPADLLAACIDGLTDPVRAGRLNAAVPTMLATAAAYNTSATAKTLHLVPRVVSVGASTADDLKSLYKDQMSSASGNARDYYNLIKNAAPNSKCPLCGVGMVRTLDHHLPQSKYPDLSVCPYNLVPSCDFCQAGKLAKYPANPGEQTLHPYYDDLTAQQWIFGSLSTLGNPVLQFHVAAPAPWPEIQQERVLRHFNVFKLGHVYTSNANDDLSTIRQRLVDLESAGGSAAVAAYLAEERDRWVSRPNSWQHVMYQTLAGNAWFVQGGYLSIPV